MRHSKVLPRISAFNRKPSLHFILEILAPIAIVAAIAAPVRGADAAKQITNEVVRLQQTMKAKPLVVPDMPNAADYVNESLKIAAAAQSEGMTYISLESLGRAEDLFQGFRTIVDKTDEVKNSLPAYEALWNKASINLTALDRQARERDWTNSRAAIRALAEAAQGRAIPLLEGGRGFAAATKPADGLLYMGEAKGETDFSAFCASLNIPRKGSGYPLRSFLPELAALQKKANDAFQPPKSIDLHPRFIALNSTIKLAEELDSSKFYAGALYQYLEAVRHYGMLDAKPLDAAQQAELKKAVAAARKKYDGSKRDESIVQLFLERAATQTVHADGTAPNEDEWKSAKVIVEQVLPAYEAAALTPPALAKSSGKSVKLTLVRWPYT